MPPALASPALDALVAALTPTAQRYPSLRAERLLGIAYIVLARMPEWQREDPLLITARYLVWIFGVDDLSDDWAVPLPALLARHAHYRAVAQGAAPDPDDELALLLAELCADLAAQPRWHALAEAWRAALGGLLAAMAAERDPRPRADLAEYMAYAHISIGALQDAWTMLIVLGERVGQAQLQAIRAAMLCEARVIRLANDLNSAEREQAEGKQNALTILAARGDGRALAEAELRWALADFRQAIDRLGAGRFAACLRATVDTTVAFYRRFTFHEFERQREVGG